MPIFPQDTQPKAPPKPKPKPLITRVKTKDTDTQTVPIINDDSSKETRKLTDTRDGHYINEENPIEMQPDQHQHQIGPDIDQFTVNDRKNHYHHTNEPIGKLIKKILADGDSSHDEKEKDILNLVKDIFLKGENIPDGIHELIERIVQGDDIFFVAGVYATGKTQMLSAFYKSIGVLIDEVKVGKDGQAVPNSPYTIEVYAVNEYVQRPSIFVDVAGENIQSLHPLGGESERTVTRKDLLVPELIANNLRGLILVIDLKTYWEAQKNVWKEQIRIVNWVVMVFRWLLYGGTYPDSDKTKTALPNYIQNQVTQPNWPRLDIPVSILFSKVDDFNINPFEVPGSVHILYPTKDLPFVIARDYLQSLHKALLRDANDFRYDFIQSIVTDKNGKVVEDKSLGVEPSLKWLLEHRSSSRLPTEYLIKLHDFWHMFKSPN